MLRFLIAIALLASCAPCYAQAKKKPAAEKYLAPDVGERFSLSLAIVAAADETEIEELCLSIDAKDKEGIDSMIDDKKAVKIDPAGSKMSLVVLDLHAADNIVKANYYVCRVVKDGKAAGKYPIPSAYFTDKNMKKEPPR